MLTNKIDTHKCQYCGCEYFESVYVLAKLSKIMYPQLLQDTLQPIQTMRCVGCKKIPTQLDPLEQQNSKPKSNLII